MKPLILHPTETSQWYALVNEAQASTNLLLKENTESYLVFLLMRFMKKAQLAESVIAMDFLEAMQQGVHQKAELLREVGDKSLLFCGLFPGIAEKRHVSLHYFYQLGQAAYLSVSELEDDTDSPLYLDLSRQFQTLQQVLRALRL